MNNSEELHQGRVEKVVAQGSGLIRSDHGVVLVPLVLPGELISYRLLPSRGKGVLRGELVQVMEPHSSRRIPPCPLYERCGGCDLMHAEPGLQGEIKKQIFLDTMSRQGGAELQASKDFLEGICLFQGQEWEYRSRYRFHRGTNGKPSLKARKTNQTIELNDCPVARPLIRSWLRSCQGIESPAPSGAAKKPDRRERAEDDDESCGGFRVFASDTQIFLEGQERAITIKDQEFRFGADAFFQSNPAMLESLLDWLRPRLEAFNAEKVQALTRDLRMADLYGGVGTFSRFLPAGGELWMVEENAQACKSARSSLGGRPGARIHCGSVDTWLTKSGPLDLAVVDPPRTGLSQSLVGHLIRLQVDFLVYVSCDPATLARDARALVASGYRLEDGALFDFYPQTWHLESVLIFRGKREV